METKIIAHQKFDNERALYNISKYKILDCTFNGINDGESPLKECENLSIESCYFYLRYPIWHNTNLFLHNCIFYETSRAPFWYGQNLIIKDTYINSVKALRECRDVKLENCQIISDEFGWKNINFYVLDCNITSNYAFFETKKLILKNSRITSKYSFQYNENCEATNCFLSVKDGFWHSKNCTIKDCIIDGEFFAWYSTNLTLINCQITGSQPFCYCKNLKLIDCTMQNCNLSFEYSDVNTRINGKIQSIKNPLSGTIICDDVGEIINENNKYNGKCHIIVNKCLNSNSTKI